MFLYILLFIYCTILTVTTIFAYPLVPSANENYQEDVAKLAAKIFLKECSKCETVLILYMEEDNTINTFFNEVYESRHPDKGWYLIRLHNFTGYQINTALYNYDLTVIFLENYSNIEEVLFNIEMESFWKLRSRFLGSFFFNLFFSKLIFFLTSCSSWRTRR